MFFLIMFIIIIFVVVTLYLPYASGLTKLEVEKKREKKQQVKTSRPQDNIQESYGYIPPDEQFRKDFEKESENHHNFNEKFQVTADDLPVRIRLQTEDSNLRRRNKEKLDLDADPNKYDYDLDELINKEISQSAEEQKREFYKDQHLGGDKEAMV
ncbi:uncharacterized protein PRCAT00004802001 [Priceomyces carsonii]|uniref:uncharacterized protein n=1 Tax=Priceomyces carsonii TaxID=28549 RepID=UPI002ED9E582|nr:unnamed protein product [Priceomyces carsonii]